MKEGLENTRPEGKTRPRRWDLRIAAALFVTGACAAMVYNATWGGLPQFWQNVTFMQGIMWSCGHGWENPMVSDVPGLQAFLDSETDCFDCGAIPDDVRVLPRDTSGMTVEEIGVYNPQMFFFGFLPWQRYHLYLVFSVTALWCLFGVCWSALGPLVGLLYGTSVVAAYGLFRLGMGRVMSTLCAVLFLVSPLHLQMAPHIRDYAKAPFLLLALLLMGCLIRRHVRPMALLGAALLCGVVIGVGLGFRADLAIAAPAFLTVVLFLLPGPFFRTLPWRIAACMVFLLGFLVAGYPILVELFRETGHFAHVTLLGFLHYCDLRLGVASDLYQVGGPYSDFYIVNMVQTYIHRAGLPMPPSTHWDPRYHEATQAFLRDYGFLVPGDLVLRAYAAVLRVLDELRINPAAPWPRNITNPLLQHLYTIRALLFDHLPGQGRYHVVLALALIACRRVRWAFGALFLLLYFAGYTALQYNLRHVFYLEFMSLWATGFLVQQLVTGTRILRGGETRAAFLRWWPGGRRLLLRVATVALVSALVLTLLLWGMRWRQHYTLGALLEQCGTATLEPLPWKTSGRADGLITVPGFASLDNLPPQQAGLPTQSEYLVVALHGPGAPVPVRFAFTADDAEHYDFSRDFQVRTPPGGDTRVYFPLYYTEESRFQGILIPPEYHGRITGVYRVLGAEHIPFWPTLWLPPDWRTRPRYQVMTR